MSKEEESGGGGSGAKESFIRKENQMVRSS